MNSAGDDTLIDDPTSGLPYGAELFARSIAVGRGEAGAVSVRATEVVVPVRDDADLARLKRAIRRSRGLTLCSTEGFEPAPGRHLIVEFEGESFYVGNDEAAGSRWSVGPVSSALRTLREAGIDARPNFVAYANNGASGFVGNPGNFLPNPGNFLPNPGNFLPNPGNFLPNPGNFLPNPSPATTLAQPATEPPGLSAPLALVGRRAPIVLILDTGLCTVRAGRGRRRAEHDHLVDRTRVHRPWRNTEPGSYDDEDEADDDRSGLVDLTAGHGTFIAGIIRQHCPDATVHIEGVLSSFGDGDDADIAVGIERAIGRIGAEKFDVIVMSFGTYTDDDTPPLMAETLAAFAAPTTALIASAGNSGSPRVQFPAALPHVVAVGALDAAGRAAFSNFGGWVDACAPGVSVVSTYFADVVETEWPKRSFEGWATWSGTSFSAPKVAATIAQDQYLNGGSAIDAWKRLSHWQKLRHPDMGIVFNL